MQVKNALLYMLRLTNANRSVFSAIIPYDSRASKILVPRDGDESTERWRNVVRTVEGMRASGGTNFRAAFDVIKDTLIGNARGRDAVLAQAFEKGIPHPTSGNASC